MRDIIKKLLVIRAIIFNLYEKSPDSVGEQWKLSAPNHLTIFVSFGDIRYLAGKVDNRKFPPVIEGKKNV
jgi:hypothetical protein